MLKKLKLSFIRFIKLDSILFFFFFSINLIFLRIALSVWSLSVARLVIKAQVSVAFLGLSQWVVCLSVGISTTCSAWWPCTTTATKTAAFSVPPARPSTVLKPATSHQERWNTTSFLTPFLDTLTAKPSGLSTTYPLAFR